MFAQGKLSTSTHIRNIKIISHKNMFLDLKEKPQTCEHIKNIMLQCCCFVYDNNIKFNYIVEVCTGRFKNTRINLICFL